MLHYEAVRPVCGFLATLSDIRVRPSRPSCLVTAAPMPDRFNGRRSDTISGVHSPGFVTKNSGGDCSCIQNAKIE